MDGLSFEALREQNHSRVKRWHPGFPGGEGDGWTGGDWGNAMAGEAGEACNVIKKLRRVEERFRSRPEESDILDLISLLGLELADTIIYADIVAQYYGIKLGSAVTFKFNATSAEYGFPERLT